MYLVSITVVKMMFDIFIIDWLIGDLLINTCWNNEW